MAFLTPLFLLLGLLAGPIILLYMLRLRRRELLVSSTLLWQKLMRDREANAPWQKLRRNLLLLLQLLILAALVFALARPFLPSGSIFSGNVVVLLDASASMQAVDVEPNRFEAAKTELNRLINDLGSNNQMTIILVGRQPQVLAPPTGDRRVLRQAMAGARVEASAANWQAAFALASGAAQGFREAQIAIISDGRLPENLPPLPVDYVFIPIGESGENVAIAALATRETEAGIELFASVSNNGLLDRSPLLSIYLDDTLYDSRRLTIPAQNNAHASWTLPAGTSIIRANLSDNEEDMLPVDDVAWAVHEGGVRNRTLLVTAGNLFLEQVFTVLPGMEVFKTTPDSDLLQQGETEDSFDLYVFDGTPLPDPLPAADLLILNPQPGGNEEIFSVTGTFSTTVAVDLVETPLLQFVDWGDVDVRAAQLVSAPGLRPLVTAVGGSLLLTGEHNGYRVALLTFDLRDSDLPLQIAFPILMANLTGWLNPGRAFDAPIGLAPGSAVSLVPGPGTTTMVVAKPDGQNWTATVGEDELLFTETEQLGIYGIFLRDSSNEQAAGNFAVNLFNAGDGDLSESAIRPRETLPVVRQNLDTGGDEAVGQRELWPWLLFFGILILIIEWWVHYRGAQLPKPDWQQIQVWRQTREK